VELLVTSGDEPASFWFGVPGLGELGGKLGNTVLATGEALGEGAEEESNDDTSFFALLKLDGIDDEIRGECSLFEGLWLFGSLVIDLAAAVSAVSISGTASERALLSLSTLLSKDLFKSSAFFQLFPDFLPFGGRSLGLFPDFSLE